MNTQKNKSITNVNKFFLSFLSTNIFLCIIYLLTGNDMFASISKDLLVFILCIHYIKKHDVTIPIQKINPKIFLICIGIVIAGYPISLSLNHLGSLLGDSTQGIDLTQYPAWQMFLLIGVLPAIIEELVFRGILISEYGKVSMYYSVLFSSIGFALMHMNLSSILYAYFYGITFSIVRLATNNISYTFFMHMFFNCMNLVIGYCFSDIEMSLPLYLNMVLLLFSIFVFSILLSLLLRIKKFAFASDSHSAKSFITKESVIAYAICIIIALCML